jgi:hypothetical protein
MSQIQIPGKVFLIGEYSVLDGGNALLVATGPGFTYSSEDGETIKPHPDSPLGKYLASPGIDPKGARTKTVTVKNKSKETASGSGLGSSTAELIAGSAFLHGKLPNTSAFWEWYRKNFPGQSGADLAVQLQALHDSHAFFEISNYSTIALRGYSPLFSRIYVFQVAAENKLATHVAIKKRPAIAVERANEMVKSFLNRFNSGLDSAFGLLNDWAEFLASLEIETSRAHSIRMDFAKVPGVIGVKGCGAGLNDVFIVGTTETFDRIDEFTKIASDHRLKFLGNLEERLWK